MKLSALLLVVLAGSAEASLRGTRFDRRVGSTESSSSDSRPYAGDTESYFDDEEAKSSFRLDEESFTESSIQLLDEKSDLATDRGSWELAVQHNINKKNEFESPNRRMLLPQLMQLDLWQYMEAVDEQFSPTYSKLMSLMAAAGLEEELRNATGVTLFAPDNEAISPQLETFLTAPENKNILVQMMDYHIVPNVVSYLSLTGNVMEKVTTFLANSGDVINIAMTATGVVVNDESRAIAFSLAKQSIIYRIDRVLVPPSLKAQIPENLLRGGDFEFPLVVPDRFMPDNIASDFPSIVPATIADNAPTEPTSMSVVMTDLPSLYPSDLPSALPSNIPSDVPSDIPSTLPSDAPSTIPSDRPSTIPSDAPSTIPSDAPSTIPSDAPSTIPSDTPSTIPSDAPSTAPSNTPSEVFNDLSVSPSTISSDFPSTVPRGDENIEKDVDGVLVEADNTNFDDTGDMFTLFSKALLTVRREGPSMTLFVPRGLQELDDSRDLNLMQPAYNLHLLSLVRYHMANGLWTKAALRNETPIETIEGGQITPIVFENDTIAITSFADEPSVVTSSVDLPGVGMVHFIDQALVPSWVTMNAMTFMEDYDQFAADTYSTFRSLVVAAGMGDVLHNMEDITLFAPQNNAFSSELTSFLLLPQSINLVANIVSYHIVPNTVVSHLFVQAAEGGAMSFPTLQSIGIDLSVANVSSGTSMFVNGDAKVHSLALVRRGIVFRVSKLLIPTAVLDFIAALSSVIPENTIPSGDAVAGPVFQEFEQGLVFPSTDGSILDTLENQL